MGVLRLGLALQHDQVELEGGVARHLLARAVTDDDADAVGLALPLQALGKVHVVAQARIGETLRRAEIADRGFAGV